MVEVPRRRHRGVPRRRPDWGRFRSLPFGRRRLRDDRVSRQFRSTAVKPSTIRGVNLSGAEHEIAESTVAIGDAGQGRIDVVELEDLVFENGKVDLSDSHPVGHLLSIRGTEPG